MTPEELHILQHSLGVDQHGRGSHYRNHFVTGPGSDDWDLCCELDERGLMKDHGKSGLCGDNHWFSVTEKGVEEMRKGCPQPPKLTRSKIRYQDYLRADCSMSFREWLRLTAGRPASQAR